MSDQDLIQTQLATLALLQAMFPVEGELELLDDTAQTIELLSGSPPQPDSVKLKALRLVINILLDEPLSPLQLEISLALLASPESPNSLPLPTLTLHQSPYLYRASHAILQSSLSTLPPTGDASEYILSAIEHLRTVVPDLVPKEPPPEEVQEAGVEELERVWFWFPSLSTREKRKDLVDYAPRYDLTGFVLAGKPGLLCLEGTSWNVDDYMSAIKSESWSDIPSYQKKVSERHRHPIPLRLFPDMQEITSQISQRGQWNNRGEMGEIRRWMEERGVGDVFGRVVGGGGGLGRED